MKYFYIIFCVSLAHLLGCSLTSFGPSLEDSGAAGADATASGGSTGGAAGGQGGNVGGQGGSAGVGGQGGSASGDAGGQGGSGATTSTGGTGGTGGGTGGSGGSGGQGGSGGGNPCPDIAYEDVHTVLDLAIDGLQDGLPTCATIFGNGVCGFNTVITRNDFIVAALNQIQTGGYSNPLNPTFTDEAVGSSAQKAVWAGIYPPPLAGAFDGSGPTTSCFAAEVAALIQGLSYAYMVPFSFTGDQSLPIGPGHVTAISYKVWGTSVAKPLNFGVAEINVTNSASGHPGSANFAVPEAITGIDVRLRCQNSSGTTSQVIVPLVNGKAEFTTLNCYAASGSFDLQIQFEITNGATSTESFRLGFDPGNDFDVRRGALGTQEDNSPLITVL